MRVKPQTHILLKDGREDSEGRFQHFVGEEVQTCLKTKTDGCRFTYFQGSAAEWV